MLTKLQPEGSALSQASRGGVGDNDPTTSTLQDAMERLHGQHLSGNGDGVDVGSFMTPAGVRCPQGKSPPDEVSLMLGLHTPVEDTCTWEIVLAVGRCSFFLEMLTLWILLHPCNSQYASNCIGAYITETLAPM